MPGLIFLAGFVVWSAIITVALCLARKKSLKEYNTKWQKKHWQRNVDEKGNIYWKPITHEQYEN